MPGNGGETKQQGDYVFPMKLAIQCIPDFEGEAEELDAFFYQADIFASDIPEGTSQVPLIQVVLMKLKGKAKKLVNRVKGDTWDETKVKIRKEFGEHRTVGNIMEQVETLVQKNGESFKDYKERGLKIMENVEAITGGKNDYAEGDLKRHFICGLQNEDLKKLGKMEKSRNFRDLVEYLEKEAEDCEQMEGLEKRLSKCGLSGTSVKEEDAPRKMNDSNDFQKGGNFRNQKRFKNSNWQGRFDNRRNFNQNSDFQGQNSNSGSNQQRHFDNSGNRQGWNENFRNRNREENDRPNNQDRSNFGQRGQQNSGQKNNRWNNQGGRFNQKN